jgi:phosphomannomutase
MPFGIMITASHNKYKDNGFKIAAFNGESAPTSWESYLTQIVNTKNLIQYFKTYIKTLAEEANRTIEEIMNTKALICYAYDTRPSSKEFDEITK